MAAIVPSNLGSSYNSGVFWQLKELGLFDIILPFILVFTLVFAILQKTKILGEKSKNFNTVISLVMGASVVLPHVLMGTGTNRLTNGLIDPVVVINNALPSVSIILIAVLMVLLIFGIWGSKVRLGNSSLSGIIALFAFLSVIYIFGGAAGWWVLPRYGWLGVLSDPNTQALVVTILVFAIIIWWITKDDTKESEKKKGIGDFFGSILDTKE